MNTKVSVVKCDNYDAENVQNTIEQAIEYIGGIKKYVSPGKKVLLKPNLIAKRKPDEAVTTHPVIVEAIAKMVINAGGTVTIADSQGGLYSHETVKSIYSVCGMQQVADNTGAILNYDLGQTEIKNPGGKYIKTLNVINPVAQADVIINIPKLKTHGQMVYTGAIKNMFGIIPGIQKGEYHFKMPEHEDFAHALIDVFLSAKPQLTIMDAIIGMEGKGPTAGDARKIGVIIASYDAFALDVVAAALIGVKPTDIPTIKNAVLRGLSPASADEIDIIGGDINKYIIKDFSVPALKTAKRITFINKTAYKFLSNILKPKPVFIHNKCTGCGICSDNCPAKVISMENERPNADLSKCIRCFCCQELCPSKAIDIKDRTVSRFIRKKKHR